MLHAPLPIEEQQEQPTALDAAHPGVTGWRRVWRRFRRHRMAMGASIVLLLLVLAAICAPLIAPHDPTQISSAIMKGPSSDHLLGTDEVGRDLLSRLLYAMRFSLVACVVATALAVIVGTTIGLFSGYLGGAYDNVLMRLTDTALAFPGLLLAMGIVGVLGPGIRNATLALAVAFTPTFVRLVRGEVLQMRREPYMEAAEVAGVRGRVVVWRHVLPNTRAPVVVQTLMTMALALLAEGALSFLGLGVQPPDASLGTLLQRGFSFIERSPRLIIVPGLTITLLAWCFNAIADGLRDALDVGELEEVSL
jgi:peptide/nickel transport system permease protein